MDRSEILAAFQALDEIRLLYRLCGFSTAAEGIALVAATYPEHLIPARTRFMLEEMYPALDVARDRSHERRRDRGHGL